MHGSRQQSSLRPHYPAVMLPGPEEDRDATPPLSVALPPPSKRSKEGHNLVPGLDARARNGLQQRDGREGGRVAVSGRRSRCFAEPEGGEGGREGGKGEWSPSACPEITKRAGEEGSEGGREEGREEGPLTCATATVASMAASRTMSWSSPANLVQRGTSHSQRRLRGRALGREGGREGRNSRRPVST